MESSEEKAEEHDSLEEEEEEEEGDDDEFFDVLDVLDGRGDIGTGSGDESAAKPKSAQASTSQVDAEPPTYEEMEQDEGEDSEEDSEEEDDDEPQDQDMTFDPSDDEEAPEALDQLNDFVSSLDVTAKKRKAPEEDGASTSADARARKRRFLKERTEAGDENEFRARSSGTLLHLDVLFSS
jgi:U3 small nucleolar RNA-associated protein 14